jgi:hypothetical protein
LDIRISKVKNPDGSTELYFEQLGNWDYYEPILKMMVDDSGCNVVEEKDMITDYDTLLKYKNVSFYYRHDYMLGNYLFITNAEDVPILETLADKVIDNIKASLKMK